MGVFARWSHPGVCRVLCVGTPPVLRQQLKTALDESPSLELRDPFAMMLPLFDQIIKLYDDSAWRVRDQVRAIEKNRASHAADFVAMHDISRHAGHLVEVHAATVETMESLLHRQRAIHDGLSSLDKTHKEQSQEYLEFQLQIIKSLQRRSLSIQERINSEITLVLCCSHGVLQTANAWQGDNIIMATQDNTVMKSIALLTVTFLPATFISVISRRSIRFRCGVDRRIGTVQHHLFLIRRRELERVQEVLDILGGCDSIDLVCPGGLVAGARGDMSAKPVAGAKLKFCW
ncbi:hypothetical protein OCS_01952 [Ophiocordyceps sinensis CO18]|uniref:Uncharacterized protein n=1 Tax=Ophiocordyceps sinensis (strain Co18 / CGMCC 3.14243) TaxID=911162 RepID=T5AA35_OPHSC|nr:hypothetical protein OCS_01952 [Ophiocordyceps sinensis CO18]